MGLHDRGETRTVGDNPGIEVAGVIPVRPLAEVVVVGGHRQFDTAGQVNQAEIHCRATVVARAFEGVTVFIANRFAHIAFIGYQLPQLFLHRKGSVAIEHL